MFRLPVDDEISLVLAEERHARAVTELILRNQSRLARWEPWAEQPQTVDGTRAYIRSSLEDFVRGRQISTIIALDRGSTFVGRRGLLDRRRTRRSRHRTPRDARARRSRVCRAGHEQARPAHEHR